MIKIVLLVEVVIWLSFVVFAITQIVMPVATNQPMFPLLRKRVRDAVGELANVNEEIKIAETQRQTGTLKQRLDTFNRNNKKVKNVSA